MRQEGRERQDARLVSRRTVIGFLGAEPPSTIMTPPRDFGPNAPPNVYFTDPDVLGINPMFSAA